MIVIQQIDIPNKVFTDELIYTHEDAEDFKLEFPAFKDEYEHLIEHKDNTIRYVYKLDFKNQGKAVLIKETKQNE